MHSKWYTTSRTAFPLLFVDSPQTSEIRFSEKVKESFEASMKRRPCLNLVHITFFLKEIRKVKLFDCKLSTTCNI